MVETLNAITFDNKMILTCNFHILLITLVKSCSIKKILIWRHFFIMAPKTLARY